MIEPRTSEQSETPDPPENQRGFEAVRINRSYRNKQVLFGVSIRVRPGEIVGLLGPNGSGKTTCFYLMAGMIRAQGGQVILDGRDVTALPMYKRARLGMSYLPQGESIFHGMNVIDNIRSVTQLCEKNRAAAQSATVHLMDRFNLDELADRNATALSGGERRRVEIARALASRPTYVLLDEPFVGIDPLAIADVSAIIRTLRDDGMGVLITDHQVRNTLKIVDRVAILNCGEIMFDGSPSDALRNDRVRTIYFGDAFDS